MELYITKYVALGRILYQSTLHIHTHYTFIHMNRTHGLHISWDTSYLYTIHFYIQLNSTHMYFNCAQIKYKHKHYTFTYNTDVQRKRTYSFSSTQVHNILAYVLFLEDIIRKAQPKFHLTIDRGLVKQFCDRQTKWHMDIGQTEF